MITELQLRNLLGLESKEMSDKDINSIREILITMAKIEYENYVQNKPKDNAVLLKMSPDISLKNESFEILKLAA